MRNLSRAVALGLVAAMLSCARGRQGLLAAGQAAGPGGLSLPAETAPTTRAAGRAAASPTTMPGCHFTEPPKDPYQPPVVERIEIPEFPGAFGIFGSTGRDAAGHIWVGVSAHRVKEPSARLFEYDPRTGELTDRGDVVGQLKQAGLYRVGEGQMKIHSRIVQAADGHLYFASMDEEGEDQAADKPPIWGSHLWRLRMPQRKWEHLLAAPEGLIAVAAGGRCVYALGYFGHRLYQFDPASGGGRSVWVGAVGGHVSRNIFADARDHAYVPRVVQPGGAKAAPVAMLVEYDAALRQVAQTPMTHYIVRSPAGSHGIVGFQPMADGSVCFLTHEGLLSRLQPAANAPAVLTEIGFFHPEGRRYTASLFTYAGRQYLMGVAEGRRGRPFEWVVYDLKARTSSALPFEVTKPGPMSLDGAMPYGSMTQDDLGGFYVTGTQGGRPVLLRVSAPRPGGQEQRRLDPSGRRG